MERSSAGLKPLSPDCGAGRAALAQPLPTILSRGVWGVPKNWGGVRPPRLPPSEPFAIHRQRLIDALWAARAAFGGRLLDLGCGDQPYRRFFGDRCTAWIGLDRVAAARPAVVGDLLCLPIRAASCDTVLCTQVLDDVPCPPALFAAAAAVLRPGGRLVLTASQYTPLHDEPRDYYRATRHALADCCARAGLQVEVLRPVGGSAALVGFVVACHLPLLRGDGRLARAARAAWQALVLALDRRWPRYGDTMGWLLVAVKP